MNMKHAFYTVLLLPLLASTCKKKWEYYIEVENQLEQNVFCLPGFNYPDTSLVYFRKDVILANDVVFYLKSAQKGRLFFEKLCYNGTWKRMLANDTLQVFIIPEKTLKDISWDSINSNHLYLRRLVYSYTDIINNGCKISIR